MEKYFSAHSIEKKRELGAYYTPRSLSQILSDWAICSKEDRVLEPSFGGCGFLEASVETLTKLGSSSAINQLYGVDIDHEAFNFLSQKVGSLTEINKKNFICRDFLNTTIKSFGGKKFEVVIGNPPYVSIHKMTGEQKSSCFKSLKNSPFSENSIGRNPSLWAFFLLHSLSFIEQDGRAAWVLPSSLLHADYSKSVISSYCNYFSSVKIFKLYERFFLDDGASEVSVIMLASGFDATRRTSSYATYSEVDNLEQLREKVFNEDPGSDDLLFKNGYKLETLNAFARQAYSQIQTESFVSRFGDIAKVSIGMVTGDNKTFVIHRDTAKINSLNEGDLKPVISRFSQLEGLNLSWKRYTKLTNDNQRTILVSPRNIEQRNTNIRKYLATVNAKYRKRNRTFRKRENWFYPDDGIRSDAFMSCMMHGGVRLVVNSAGINCTNSLHRVFFKNKVSKKHQKAIAVSMLSSLTQLSAEIEGRSYGSGVLKLEPTPTQKLLVIFHTSILDTLFDIYPVVDKLLISNDMDKARQIVDSTITKALGVPEIIFDEFNLAVQKLRIDRYKGLSKGANRE